jgi:hypothetical protein
MGRITFAVIGTLVYWGAALATWVVFVMGTMLGDCIGPTQRACFQSRSAWWNAELLAIPFVVAGFLALVLFFRRRWKRRG